MRRLIRYIDGSEKTVDSKEDAIKELMDVTKDILRITKIEYDPKDDSDEYIDLPF